MNIRTQHGLVSYLNGLREEGFVRLHVTDVIPRQQVRNPVWNRFPNLDQRLLDNNGIVYDRTSGWFTLDKNWVPANGN